MERINLAFYCEKCSLQFDKKIVFDIHLSFVHKISSKVETEEKEIEIKEEDSGSVFQSNKKKTNPNIVHLNSISEGKKSHNCTICDYTTSHKGHLNFHIKSVHEGKKPHKCTICDYSSSRKETLNQHIKSVHEGKKPHKCSICDYSTSSNGNLKKHIEAVHEGKRPHKCSICDSTFSTKGNLKQHIKSTH